MLPHSPILAAGEVDPRVLGSPVNRYVAKGCPHNILENENSTHVLCETSASDSKGRPVK